MQVDVSEQYDMARSGAQTRGNVLRPGGEGAPHQAVVLSDIDPPRAREGRGRSIE